MKKNDKAWVLSPGSPIIETTIKSCTKKYITVHAVPYKFHRGTLRKVFAIGSGRKKVLSQSQTQLYFDLELHYKELSRRVQSIELSKAFRPTWYYQVASNKKLLDHADVLKAYNDSISTPSSEL